MSEYKVTYTEVPPVPSGDEKYSGLLIRIQPPVQLNPDAVTRYLSFSDFAPIDSTENWEGHDIKDAAVLGSTPEQTTIYASIDRQYAGLLAEQAANNTVTLLRFMGAMATIDKPPTPDA